MIVDEPWINQTITSNRQKAKNGARLAICAVRPANRSKKPTRLDTSLGFSNLSGVDRSGFGEGVPLFTLPPYDDRRKCDCDQAGPSGRVLSFARQLDERAAGLQLR